MVLQLKDWLEFRSLDEQMETSSTTSSSSEGERKRPRKEANSEADLDGEEEMSVGTGSSEGSSPYERDPALGELLQFLLSLPYADEGLWGVADLILVSGRHHHHTIVHALMCLLLLD